MKKLSSDAPSTGLPEELEKIVQKRFTPILRDMISREKGSELCRDAIRDVLDWACARTCELCRDGGSELRKDGHGWIHGYSDGTWGRCAASVLREGLK